MITRTLLLIRHGETAWNAEGRWQGQTDIGLAESGRSQARVLGARLGALWARGVVPTPTHAAVSDLSRARETLDLILASSGCAATVRIDPRLRERSFGSWEGKTAAEIGHAPGSGERPADAEPNDCVMERMVRALDTLWETQAQTMMIVGHGGSLRALLAHVAGLGVEGMRRFQLGNTSLSIVTLMGETLETAQGRLVRVNDTAHLERE